MTSLAEDNASLLEERQPDGSSRYLAYSRLMALLVAVIGTTAMLGWLLQIELLKRLAPTFVAMNPATSMAFVLAAASLWFYLSDERSGYRRHAASVCAALVTAIGVLKLLSFIGLETRIDQILFHSQLAGDAEEHPNRMAPNTAMCFALIGCALLLLGGRSERRLQSSQVLALITGLISLLALIGYTYSATAFYGVAAFIPMALHTAMGFLLISIGVLTARPHDGFMSLLTSQTTGGVLARRLLPAVIVIPPTLGWLRLRGEYAGLFNKETGISLLVMTTIVLFLGIIWWTARQLRQSDSARARAELAVRTRAEEISDLYNNAPCGYHSLNNEGVFIEINETELAWLGYERDEMVGRMNFRDVLTPESRVIFAERFPKFKQKGVIREVEFELLRKDGSTMPVLLSATALRDADGNFISTRSTVFDITERREAESANARLASIVEHTNDAVISEDLDGRILSWNRGAEKLFGYTANEVVGRPISVLVPPELSDEVPELLECVTRDEAVDHYETVRMTKNGRRLHVSLTLSPVKNKRGEVVGVSKIARDITSRKEAEDQLARAKAMAEDANRTKSEFLANMSHEIRTPMMAIIGYADLLLDVNQCTSERLNAVNVIRRNAGHLLAIINDILDLSKIEAGELHVEQISCSPCQIIYEVVSLMRVRAAEKKLEFKARLDGLIPEIIQTDPTRLRQILINLVGNAIKFTESGWVKLIVQLIEPDSDNQEPMLRFDVIDTGIGMSSDQMNKLFRPFGQADSSTTRQFGGTGLGLVISQRLANMLGGRIEVDSTPGRGSTFSTFIRTGPLDQVKMISDCREAVSVTDGSNETRDELMLSGRILLAEDGYDNRQLLAQYLRLAGAEVTEAENGRIACNKAIEAMRGGSPFDLIVMDMQMPELDGYGAASKLRANGYAGPIVALTAHAMADDREKCLNAGCTDYLSKPLSRDLLIRTLALHLEPDESVRAGHDDSGDESPEDCLFSELTDEAIMPYLNAFIDSMPSKISELQKLLAEEDLNALRELVHQIKGSGGLFGFIPITDKAEEVEQLLEHHRPTKLIAKELDKLVALMERAGGSKSHSPGSPGSARTV